MLRSLSFSLLWRGLLAIAIGVASVAWPDITVGAFVILFAVYALLAAVTDFGRAFSSDRVGPVVGYLLLALLSVTAAIVALVWPDITALALTIWVAAWALVTGVLEITMAFAGMKTAGERAMWGLGGLISAALGIVLLIRPDIGALSLATVFGLFSIAYGVTMIMLSMNTRRLGGDATHLSDELTSSSEPAHGRRLDRTS